MRIHRVLSHEAKFACLSCNKERYFQSRNGIESHYSLVHSKEYKKKKGEIDSALAAMEKALKKRSAGCR